MNEVRVRESKGHGLGVFAVRALASGELIRVVNIEREHGCHVHNYTIVDMGATDNNLTTYSGHHSWVPPFAITHGGHVHTSTLVDLSPGFGTMGNCVSVYVAP